MTEDPQRASCTDELAFFGRVGADVSHDMRNVLSIIGQYAGLLDDLIAMAKGRKGPDPARLKDLSAKIAGQVARGTETMERLSRFAHAADERTASFDLVRLTENTAALARRRVALAGCTLEAELPDAPIPVRNNPFGTQYAVFAALEHILQTQQKGKAVTVKLTRQGGAATISVSGSAGPADVTGPLPGLSATMEKLGGSVESSAPGGAASLILTIPAE